MAASDLCRYRRDVQPLVPRSHRRSVYRGCRGGHGGDERAAGQPVLHEGGGGLGTDRGGGGGVGRRRMNASHLIMHVFFNKKSTQRGKESTDMASMFTVFKFFCNRSMPFIFSN